ncbi:MAG: hypothetical protein Q8M16_06000 [Pirellulaceae bacterium]|nr:hypothetical protein [Pirellulaceae bacterium]
MFRTLIALSTGGLCTLGLCFPQDLPVKNEITVEMRATSSQDEVSDPAKIAAELRELRSQLLTVLGPNHPAVRKIDVQIRQITTEGSLAENLFAPQIVRSLGGALQGGAEDGWLVAQGVDGADLMIHGSENMPSEFNVNRRVFVGPGSNNIVAFAAESGRNFDFGGALAALRQKWDGASDDAARQTVIEELKKSITEQFDADLARRRQQVDDLEKKLGELRKQIAKREDRRDDFVQVLTKHTEMEWEGISLQSNRREGVFTGPMIRQRASVAPVTSSVAPVSPPGSPAAGSAAPASASGALGLGGAADSGTPR